ncbi:MAG: type IV secretory system conjugative DNA transfer family protein, partial [Clostridiales bacterium]|nr:type IV secretory system conjugative DNA transfer family protein [Clostridiales bacterium]
RDESSRAYQLAKNVVLENGGVTRSCILAVFNTGISMFRDCAMRLVTSCNSFEMSELVGGPVAIFINYKDEVKVHYQLISLFVQDAYRYLIEQATEKPNGKLEVPFYFILDEFGNFAKINDFDTTISACAGRNIWFMLVIQSYAQLNNVYGADVAEIIRDNLNVHVFFGSNNPATLDAFSNECGKYTRISPLSALNGNGADIEHYQIETIPLVPKSMLSHFQPGECIITEANSGYVMLSKLERYYLCDEFKNLPLASEKDYTCSVNPFDKRYKYVMPKKKRHGFFD